MQDISYNNLARWECDQNCLTILEFIKYGPVKKTPVEKTTKLLPQIENKTCKKRKLLDPLYPDHRIN